MPTIAATHPGGRLAAQRCPLIELMTIGQEQETHDYQEHRFFVIESLAQCNDDAQEQVGER